MKTAFTVQFELETDDTLTEGALRESFMTELKKRLEHNGAGLEYPDRDGRGWVRITGATELQVTSGRYNFGRTILD